MTTNGYTPTKLDQLGENIRLAGLLVDVAHADLRRYTRRALAANPAPYEALVAAKAAQAAANAEYLVELAQRPDLACHCDECATSATPASPADEAHYA